MNGGTISNNTSQIRGGGVNVGADTNFVMSGGTIYDNTARYGGGAFNGGTFTMSGNANISGNTAAWGGGVRNDNATFTMNGGTISNNDAIRVFPTSGPDTGGFGGGVSNFNSTFTMNDGIISYNNAISADPDVPSQGGAVSNHGNSDIFNMNGGIISGNTAVQGGGVAAGQIFNMSGGRIFGNTADEVGDGVFNASLEAIITHTGGIIADSVHGFTVGTHVAEVEVTTQPLLSYIPGGTLDLSGLTVTLTMGNASTQATVFADFTANDLTADPAHGTVLTIAAHNGNPIVITHGASGQTASTNNITVAAPTAPAIPATPTTPAHGISAPSPRPGTPAFILHEAMAAARRAVSEVAATASNYTTAESILGAVRAVMPQGAAADWSSGTQFALVPATVGQDGSISGLLIISAGPYSSAIPLNITIPAPGAAGTAANTFFLQLDSFVITDQGGNAVITMDVLPVIQDERTLIPVRFISGALGANVGWNADTRQVTLTQDGQRLTFVIGQTAPGMDVPAQIIGDRTMVPLRFISEFFGATVIWHETERLIEITR